MYTMLRYARHSLHSCNRLHHDVALHLTNDLFFITTTVVDMFMYIWDTHQCTVNNFKISD